MADEDKFLTIKDGVVTACDKSATEIAIPDGVTKIRKRAFLKCKSLTSITIPASVTKIGKCAFYGCQSLAEITIPSSVTEIGGGAFFECQLLAGIRFGGTESQWKAVEKDNCRDRTIPVSTVHCTDEETQHTDPVVSGTANGSGPLTIEDGVVTGCDKSATEIIILEGVTEIGEKAFSFCKSLASITIPNSVTYIGYKTFADCRSLADITIPNGVTYIGRYAFYYCESLASITIPDSVTKIGYKTFAGCQSLAEITIPDSVAEIGNEAFYGCRSLADIRFGGTESQWKAVKKGEDWNSGVSAITVHCTDGEMQLGPLTIESSVVTGCDKSATEIAIPEGVTGIGEYAFRGCQSLAGITIPNSVTRIGICAFEDCRSLADIRFDGTKAQWKAVERGQWRNDDVPTSTVRCMDGETQLWPLTIEGGVVTGYDKSATEIAIPEGVTEIGAWAFAVCESLADIRFGGTKSQWKAVEKGEDWNSGLPACTVRCTDGETQLTL